MAEQRFRWMERGSGNAKVSRWNTAANAAAPREALYYGPRIGRTEITPEFLDGLRRTFWSGVDAKLDETLVIDGVPLLRVTMPRVFVPHFDADDGTTFYLYRAVSALTVVDFGKLWGGPLAEPPRLEPLVLAIPDADLPPDPTDTPAPSALLRADPLSEELPPVTMEVDPLPPPKITERMRPGAPPPRDVDLPEDRVPAPIWVSDVPVTVTPAAPPPLRIALTLPPKRPAEPPKPEASSNGAIAMAIVLVGLAIFLLLAVVMLLSSH